MHHTCFCIVINSGVPLCTGQSIVTPLLLSRSDISDAICVYCLNRVLKAQSAVVASNVKRINMFIFWANIRL